MARKAKLGDRGGVAEWEALATVGDVRRYLRWVVLSLRNQTLEANQASIFAQIGGVLLKATQADNLEARIRALEARQQPLIEAEVQEAEIVS
jgi:hypothetical protein